MSDQLERFLSGGEPLDDGGTMPAAEGHATASEHDDDTGDESAAPAQVDDEPAEQADTKSEEPEDFDPTDPAEQTPEARAGLRKALTKERERRKAEQQRREEYERRVAQLEGSLSVYQRGDGAQKNDDSDDRSAKASQELFLDPEKFVSERVSKATAQMRIEMSEEMMRASHEDFDDMVEHFVQATQKQPHLIQQMRSAKNPARFAYDYGKTVAEIGEASDLNSLREKIRAEEREKAIAEARKELALESAAKASTTSAGARGSGRTSPVSNGHISMDEILAGR